MNPTRIASQYMASHLPDPGKDEAFLNLQSDLLDRLISKGESRRLGRTSDIDLMSVSFNGSRVEAWIQGQAVVYDTRITFWPHPGHKCTCPDWVRNGLRVGPCKHVLRLAEEWRTVVDGNLAALDFGRTASGEPTWAAAAAEGFDIPSSILLDYLDKPTQAVLSGFWRDYEDAVDGEEEEEALDTFLDHVGDALESIREDASEIVEQVPAGSLSPDVGAVTKEAKGTRNPMHLVMVDFDGTLFNSQGETPDWWTKPGQYSWGADPRSIEPPCVPEHPVGPDYWNMKVVNAAKEAAADSSTYLVLITGRLATHEPRIKELLAQQGIHPDGFYFNHGGSASAFKKHVFGLLLIKFPTIRSLDIWEDENNDMYGSFVRTVSKEIGHDIELEVHRVSEKVVPAHCGPQDFPGEMRVAGRLDESHPSDELPGWGTEWTPEWEQLGWKKYRLTRILPNGHRISVFGAYLTSFMIEDRAPDGGITFHGRPNYAQDEVIGAANEYIQKTYGIRPKMASSPTGVGLFIPVPEPLSEQFPKLGKEDTSPPHVTLLYVGSVPKERQPEFKAVVSGALGREPGPVYASFGEPDFFVQPDKGRRVWFSRVEFSKDVAAIRDRVWNALSEAGFDVQHSFPLSFVPHATLAYVEGDSHSHARWVGVVPKGAWSFDSVEVWGLGKEPVVVPLGVYGGQPLIDVATPSAGRVASDWTARLGSEYRVDDDTWQVVGTIHPTFEAAVEDVFERASHPKMNPLADMPHGKTFLWHDLYVDEDARDAGLGREIVQHVESDLRRQGVQAIVLHASDYSGRPSRGFWEHMGYTLWMGDDPSDPVCWKAL